MPVFDYPTIAKEAGINSADLDRLVEQVRAEFPGDPMMSDLHILRACMAVRDGFSTIAEILGGAAAGLPSA